MNTGISNKIGGKYELIHPPLGEGGFGRTYLARDEDGNEYAVKKFTFYSNKQSDIDLAKGWFQREVKTLQNLNGHPHIPRFVEYIEENQELLGKLWEKKLTLIKYLQLKKQFNYWKLY